MTSNLYSIESPIELRALMRVFREAKFCLVPDDTEVSESPIVARMFKNVIENLIEIESSGGNIAAKERWERWLTIDENRDEWTAATNRAITSINWPTMTLSDRENYVAILLSPFNVSNELVSKFVTTVNSRRLD